MRRIHQTAANRAILHRRINSNRPNTCDDVAFVEKIAADNPAIEFCNDGTKVRVPEHPC